MTGEGRLCRPVLVVDDDEGCRALVASLLRQAGFEALEAATGEEALAAARRERPLLFVLDVCLPGLSGYEVCRTLKEDFGAAVPVIFVSGVRTEPFDRVAGLLVGADDYLVKPFVPDELLARVRALLRRAPRRLAADNLTARELKVLNLLAEGRNQDEIARELVISSKTVGTHIEHILTKLGVHSRAAAVAAAYRDHLVES